VCEYKCLRLPFVSYWRGYFNFYCGWRNRGQFGFEFKFSKPKEKRAKEPVTTPPPVAAEHPPALSRPERPAN
jgi:hypothetical protein